MSGTETKRTCNGTRSPIMETKMVFEVIGTGVRCIYSGKCLMVVRENRIRRKDEDEH